MQNATIKKLTTSVTKFPVDRVSLDREFFELLEHGPSLYLAGYDIDKFFWDDDNLANRLSANGILDFLISERRRFECGVCGVESDGNLVTQLSVYL
jgi:hypothetical protein